jgi:hypothetical protein
MAQRRKLFTKDEMKKMEPNSIFFSKDQIDIINTATPVNETEENEEDGFKYKSVKPAYTRKLLDIVFGMGWRLEIVSEEYNQHAKEVIVKGVLHVYSNLKDVWLKKDQFGAAKVSFETLQQGSANHHKPSNLGNAYKAAGSDCLKKCANQLGFHWDIYSQRMSEPSKEDQSNTSYPEQSVEKRLLLFIKEATNIESFEMYVGNYELDHEITPKLQKEIDSIKSKLTKP